MVANEVFKKIYCSFHIYHEHRLWLTHRILLQKVYLIRSSLLKRISDPRLW